MKHVKIVFPGWIEAPNGVAQFVFGLKKNENEFMRHDIRLSVFSLDDATMRNRKFEDKVQIKKKASFKDKLMKTAKCSHILTYIMIWFTMIRHSKKVLAAYKRCSVDEKVDLIHFQDLITCYYYLKKESKSAVPVYVTIHSNGTLWSMLEGYYPRFRSFLFAPMKRRIEKVVLEKVAMINFVADTARKNFCSLYPFVDSDKTSFVYNGISDISNKIKLEHLGNSIDLVCVGTLCGRKNQIGILQALSLLNISEQQNYSVTFVGDGPDRSLLEQYASTLTTKVYFVGSSNNVDEYLIKADAFILFSKDEGLPISIIEAMRCGLPIISTDIAGIPEMIEDGISGYLVNVDVVQLSTLLKKMLKEKPDWNKMGRISRSIYEKKFTKEFMISSYAKLWDLKK